MRTLLMVVLLFLTPQVARARVSADRSRPSAPDLRTAPSSARKLIATAERALPAMLFLATTDFCSPMIAMPSPLSLKQVATVAAVLRAVSTMPLPFRLLLPGLLPLLTMPTRVLRKWLPSAACSVSPASVVVGS
mgnify:CR=1 FL=1